ncbi:alpha/beta fold hydrolase [Thalassotalea agarivorans]|uniref:Alpha/beta hydrolase family protein n=1 Tax=Thalassotalea agarivorans TaxID=349064 RepID=A0A1I0G9D8_THASX|nr:alpha/beta fold hydrolase [Thalassotalea agarivorans]SET67378.1 Alpha/beta hydrolase family protein [Thalassotalea agarivorans]
MIKTTIHFTKCALILLVGLTLMSGCSSSHHAPVIAKNETVIVAHGLARSAGAMWQLEEELQEQGYQVCLLDYDSLGETVDDVLADTSQQITNCLPETGKVHFVGHSLGGLVIKSYLNKHQETLPKGELGEVILAGTPNSGSEVADHLKDSLLMDWGGDISRSLSTKQIALWQKEAQIEKAVGVIAGTKPSRMTKDLFSGKNDGLVSVASASAVNVKDIIELPISHSAMRKDDETARQIIYFLSHGKFQHTTISEI